MSDQVLIALIAAFQVVVLAAIATLNKVQTSRQVAAVSADVRSVKKDTVETNEAVNHKETGMPTLVTRVVDQDRREVTASNDLEHYRQWEHEAMRLLAEKLQVVLPEEPVSPAPLNVRLPK